MRILLFLITFFLAINLAHAQSEPKSIKLYADSFYSPAQNRYISALLDRLPSAGFLIESGGSQRVKRGELKTLVAVSHQRLLD